jgi:hypothetical protein
MTNEALANGHVECSSECSFTFKALAWVESQIPWVADSCNENIKTQVYAIKVDCADCSKRLSRAKPINELSK